MGAGAGVPREVTVGSSSRDSSSSLGSSASFRSSGSSSSERDFLQASQDLLPDLGLQDLSRKFADARSRLRHYDCTKADQRLKEWDNERKALNAQRRMRKSLARQSLTVHVKPHTDAEVCMSPPHFRGSMVTFAN
jgi:hypothetical protein